MKISQVAATYGISKRTLRYYEEMGLLESSRDSTRDERCYNNKQLKELEHILLLKKVGLSLKTIEHLLRDKEVAKFSDQLYKRLESIEEKIQELSIQKHLVKDMLYLQATVLKNEIDFYELIKEKVYLQDYIQKIEGMDKYMKDMIILEFGEALIPIVVEKDLVKQVGELKNKINKTLDKELPLVRIRDNMDLKPTAYRIVVKEVVIITKELINITCPLEEMLETLEDAIVNNIQSII